MQELSQLTLSLPTAGWSAVLYTTVISRAGEPAIGYDGRPI